MGLPSLQIYNTPPLCMHETLTIVSLQWLGCGWWRHLPIHICTPCAQAHIDIYLNIIFMNNLTHILWSIKHKSFTINFNINYISQFLFILLWHFSLSFLSLFCTSFCLYLTLPHPSNFTPFLSLYIYMILSFNKHNFKW